MSVRSIVAVLLVAAVPIAGAERKTLAEPAGPLVLADALALVLEQSPQLAMHAWPVRAAEARRVHAGARTNPEISLLLEDAAGTGDFEGVSQAQTTLELGQVIELGGKRRERIALAKGAEDEARGEYEVRRLEVLGDAAIAFVHVVADQHRVALAVKARELAEAGLAAAEKRVQAGAASAVDEQRARVLLARSKIEEEHVEHELLSSRRRLAAMWGATEPRFTEAKADLFARAVPPPFEELAARIERNPELRRLSAERVHRSAALSLARSRAVPDVRAVAGARRLEGPDAVAFLAGVSVPLPVFSRNQGDIAEANARRSQVDDEAAATRVALLTRLFGEYQELVHVTTALDSLEKEVLPQADAMLQAVGDGFRLGRFSQLELVDAQRTLIEVRNEHIDAAEEYHTFVVRIEELLGEPLRPAPATPKGQP